MEYPEQVKQAVINTLWHMAQNEIHDAYTFAGELSQHSPPNFEHADRLAEVRLGLLNAANLVEMAEMTERAWARNDSVEV